MFGGRSRLTWGMMPMRRALIALSIALPLVLGTVAHADGMRCGQRLANTGETLGEVRGKCGPPTSAERHVEYNQDGTGTAVDTWVYDRGPHDLIRILKFVNGRLRLIEVGGYGN
jgi:hypothetical protein